MTSGPRQRRQATTGRMPPTMPEVRRRSAPGSPPSDSCSPECQARAPFSNSTSGCERPPGNRSHQEDREHDEQYAAIAAAVKSRRSDGQVVVDVVVPEQRQLSQSGYEQERNQACQDARNHVCREPQHAARTRRQERERPSRVSEPPVAVADSSSHQAGHLERGDASDERATDDQRQ